VGQDATVAVDTAAAAVAAAVEAVEAVVEVVANVVASSVSLAGVRLVPLTEPVVLELGVEQHHQILGGDSEQTQGLVAGESGAGTAGHSHHWSTEAGEGPVLGKSIVFDLQIVGNESLSDPQLADTLLEVDPHFGADLSDESDLTADTE
jgi:hypothetical protein